jgi:hypothetical protein
VVVAVLGVVGSPALAHADGWATTGSMKAPRRYHAGILLNTGRVLVSGGADFQAYPVKTSELFDPALGTWASTGSMGTPRSESTTTLLADGTVLQAGGYITNGTDTATAELYNPASGAWTSTLHPMSAARARAASVLLPDGRVLIVGGRFETNYFNSAELYTPPGPSGDKFNTAHAMGAARSRPTATLLPSGKVLVAGGETTGGDRLDSAEVYDPASDTWTATGPMRFERADATATLLANGTVLVAGGSNASGYLGSAETYDPATNAWTATSGGMGDGRRDHTATLLSTGRVLIAGGGTHREAAELYDPSARNFSPAATMHDGRTVHSATALCSGKVLVAGGIDRELTTHASAELYTPDLPAPPSGNLLINGDAEASVAGAATAPVGWVASPNFTVASYGAGGGFPDGSGRLFTGGPSTPSSTACQTVDVSGASAVIDAGRVTAMLSADIGGYATDGDSARVNSEFLGAAGETLGSFQTGPVSAADRDNKTKLLPRFASGALPAGTRSIKVTITAVRASGSYNDAYVDNVALTLKTAAPAPPPAPVLKGLAISPSAFRAASSGPTASAKKKKKPPIGAKISYTDSQAATATLTVMRRSSGRSVNGKCVRPSKGNAKKKACTRYVKAGAFTHKDAAGPSSIRFSGRLGGHKLAPASYRLEVKAKSAGGKVSATLSRSFKIVG